MNRNCYYLPQPLYLKLIVLITIFISFSCRRTKSPSWDLDLVAPIAQASLNINHLLPDSLTSSNPDHTVDLIYHQNIYHKTVNELLTPPDTGFSSSLSLKDMTLSDNSLIHTLSLGQICEQGGVAGATVIANHGSMLAIPAISSSNTNNTDVDISSLFKQANIVSGELEIDLTNNFPVDLQDFIFSLSNKSDNSIITQDTFKLLKANGGNEVHHISLAGKKVEGIMVGTVINLYSPGSGSNQVLIDTAANSVFKISVKNLKVNDITAIFPNKKLIEFDYPINLNLGDVALKTIIFDTALFEFVAYNTFPENIKLQIDWTSVSNIQNQLYIFPLNIAKGNFPNATQSIGNIDWSGHTVDLSGPNKNQTNQLNIHIIAWVDSTGIPSTITTSDYIKFELKIKKLKIKEAIGYFGQHNISIDEKASNIKVFDRIASGDFFIGKLQTSFLIENSMGINARIKFDQMNFYNSTDTSVLNGSIFNQPFNIGRGLYKPNSAVKSSLIINEYNSNITQIIQKKPKGYHVKINTEINPNGNLYNNGDFVFGNSYFKVDLAVKMPVQIIAKSLVIADTIEYRFPRLDNEETIKEALLKLSIQNGFPVEAKLNIYVLGADKKAIDSFFTTSNYIAAGIYNKNDPAYCLPSSSTLEEFADLNELLALKQGYYIVVKAYVNTKSGDGTLYDTYFLNVKIAANVLYKNKM